MVLPSRCLAATGEGEGGVRLSRTGFPPWPSREAADGAHRRYAQCGQVFGLAGATGSTRSPTGRRFPDLAVQCFVDGCRSHSPLRGSPGFAPGSLLRRPTRAAGGRTSAVVHRMGRWADVVGVSALRDSKPSRQRSACVRREGDEGLEDGPGRGSRGRRMRAAEPGLNRPGWNGRCRRRGSRLSPAPTAGPGPYRRGAERTDRGLCTCPAAGPAGRPAGRAPAFAVALVVLGHRASAGADEAVPAGRTG